MIRGIVSFAVAMLLVIHPGSELNGQLLRDAPLPGQDFGSARLHLGMLAPLTTFTDDMYGESSFESGFAVGASVLVWPFQGRLGLGANLMRSSTEGTNSQYEFAPIALNDPVQWLFTGDVVVRHLMDNFSGFPYVSAGVGLKQYNWAVSIHSEDRFFLWNLAAGLELRPSALGPFALSAEVRSYHSKFIGFGIDDGTWEPGTNANPAWPGIGFYGGVVGGQSNHDLLFTTAITMPF